MIPEFNIEECIIAAEKHIRFIEQVVKRINENDYSHVLLRAELARLYLMRAQLEVVPE